MHKEYTFYFCNWSQFLLNFYIMKKIFALFFLFLAFSAAFCYFQAKNRINATSENDKIECTRDLFIEQRNVGGTYAGV